MESDKIFVRSLSVRNIIGVDNWERSKRQPLSITLTLHTNIAPSGSTDALSKSISYSTVAKKVQAFSEQSTYRSIEALAIGIVRVCVMDCGAEKVTVRVEKPRALLHAEAAGVELTRSREELEQMMRDEEERRLPTTSSLKPPRPSSYEPIPGTDQIFIRSLTLNTIIGVNPWEREEKQRVLITLIIHLTFPASILRDDRVPVLHNYRTLTRTVSKHVEEATYKTVEALAT
ncbi:trifunctional dihydropteroate synthetase, partial [Quaeritorhiza haematococci]